MSSSSSSSSFSSSVPSIKCIDIVLINRISSAHTLLAAQAFRNSYYPTHHAKRRARKLSLTVDISKARKLDQKFISTVPLPILESSPLPPTQQAPVYLAKLEPAHELSQAVVGREREMKRLARPVLRCDIPEDVKSDSRTLSSSTSTSSSRKNSGSASSAKTPCVLRGRNIPWVGPTSQWSASTTGDDGSPDRSSVYSFDSVDDLGLSDPREYETDESPTFEVIDDSEDRKLPLKLELGSCNWESGRVNGDSPLSTNSTGPVTPEDQESAQPNVVIRMKRSIPSDLELGDETLEKRPKYERKSWVSRAKRSVKMSTHDSKP